MQEPAGFVDGDEAVEELGAGEIFGETAGLGLEGLILASGDCHGKTFLIGSTKDTKDTKGYD